MYVINPWNSNWYDLPLDGDQRLVARIRIYFINDDIVERLNNGSSVGVYIKQI